MGILYKVQEFLADRISWVQYPNVRGPKLQVFRYQMPLSSRIALVVFSLITIVISAGVLAFLTFLAYSVLS